MFEYIEHKAETVRNINYLLIPINRCAYSPEGAEKFNKIFFDIKQNCKDFKKIVRTPKGGISITKQNFRPYMWDLRKNGTCVELTVIAGFYGMFRVQLRYGKDTNKIWGRTAFAAFKKICKEFNINIEDFAIDDGKEVKKTIPKAFGDFERPYYEGMRLEHVYHLDLNSSYMSGIALAYPALAPAIKYIFDMRKDPDKEVMYKAILTHTYGFMQSSQINYKYAHLSKTAIEFNNKKILEIRNKMIKQGFKPILYNTDGIWYTHPEGIEYHDEDEGTQLGQYKNDHKDCIFEALSKGKYHYIENGTCVTVIKGSTRLDRVKSRDEWTWEDMYNTKNVEVLYINFDEENGATWYYA